MVLPLAAASLHYQTPLNLRKAMTFTPLRCGYLVSRKVPPKATGVFALIGKLHSADLAKHEGMSLTCKGRKALTATKEFRSC